MDKKTILRIFLNTLLGLSLVVVWLQFVDLGQIVKTISQVNILGLLPVFLLMLLSAILRAFRFQIFIGKIKWIPLKDLIFLTGLAMMLNYFIPIRAGEIGKGIYLSTNYGLNLGKAVIWTFLDRFVDLLVVLLVATGFLFIVPTSLSISFIIVIIIILTLALVLTYLVVSQVNFTQKLVKFLSYLLIINSIKIYFVRFSHFIIEAFSILRRHPKDLVLMVGITILAYGADAGIWYFTFQALSSPQPFFNMYLGQLLSALTYLIPAAPGYIGSAEASGVLILSGVFGLETNLASAMIVLFHILSAIFILVFGLISVFSLKVNMGQILKRALKRG